MGTALTVQTFEKQLDQLSPQFAEVLVGDILRPERLIRTMVVSVERNPRLLSTSRTSLFASAMSAAVLNLEVDGLTGQAFLVPFGKECQLVIGYKGFNTLAARSGVSIAGGVVREGDAFDYELGSAPFVRHKPALEAKRERRILAAWSVATHKARPPVATVIPYDEIVAIMNRAPAVKAGVQTPWKDHAGPGHEAMVEKTAKRRLARSIPFAAAPSYGLGAALDETFEERGLAAHVGADRLIHTGSGETVDPWQASPTPQQLAGPEPSGSTGEEEGGDTPLPPPLSDFRRYAENKIEEAATSEDLAAWWNEPAQKAQRQAIAEADKDAKAPLAELRAKVVAKLEDLGRK